MSEPTRYKIGLVATGEDGRGMGFPGLIPDPNGFVVLFEDYTAAERRGAERALRWRGDVPQYRDVESLVSDGLSALFPEGGR